ncbi:MAG TPA: right-handed parallel beta-helix repeat-containing protein [Rhizomicrobium sp.]|jgi:hypothetical protein
MRILAVLFLLSLMVATTVTTGRAFAASDELLVYVDARAHAGGDGRTPATAFNDIGTAAQTAAATYAGQSKIRIEIAPGTYVGQKIDWRWQTPSALIIEGMPGNPRPDFDGGGSSTHWASFRPPATNITIRHVAIRNYYEGIVFSYRGANSNETIEDNSFQNIGLVPTAYAVIGFGNTSNSVIRNNTFVDISNNSGCGGLHAIYAQHGSSSNLIENNRFENVCGQAIKLRDRSNNNQIVNNRFVGPQTRMMVVESYQPGECQSIGNVVRGNTSDSEGVISYKSAHAKDVPGCPVGIRFAQ